MIFDNTRKDFSYIVLSALLLIAIYWGKVILLGAPADSSSELSAPFNLSIFFGKSGLIISALLCFISALFLYRLCFKHQIIPEREHLPVYFYICTTGAFPQYQSIEVQLSIFFILLFLDKLMVLYRMEYDLGNTFLAGFSLMIASLFCDNALLLFIPAFIGLFLLKPIKWRDVVVFITGFIYPAIVSMIYCYFKFSDIWYSFESFSQILTFVPQQFEFSIWQLIFASFLLIIVLAEVFRMGMRPTTGVKQKTIMVNTLMFWILVFSGISLLFLSSRGLLILSMSLAIILANFFSSLKGRLLANIFLFLFWILSLFACYL